MKSRQANPAAFRTLIVAGLACLAIGLATPVESHGRSLFSQTNSEAVGLLAVLALPMLIATFASARSPGAIGVAAGTAMFAGVALGLVWSLTVAVLTTSESGLSPGPGLFFLIASSVLLIVAALTSMRFRVADSAAANSPIAVLGVIATIATVVGALIPARGFTFKEWMGFEESGWIGLISVSLLAAYLFIGLVGFRGGRWGLGLVAGFVGEILLGNVAAGNGGNLISAVSQSNTNWNSLAKVGFFATAGLLVVHLIQTLSTRSTVAGVATGTSNPMPTTFQPPPTAFGQQQNPAPPAESAGWWNQSTGPSAAVAPTPLTQQIQPIPVPTQVTQDNPARWATDPFGRHEFRYWDGRTWTDTVADYGVSSTDPAVESPRRSGFAPPSAGA